MIARFSDEWIEQVKSSADIVDVVERHVNLKPAGRNYVGLCPFHDEKTPSFSVNQEKQFYYCFGCGAGGNVINFIMQMENLAFPEAAILLARQAGITVPNLSPQQTKVQEQQDILREINRLAAQYYYRNLRGSFGNEARVYLQNRGINESLMRSFFLGYAGQEWDGLTNFLKSQGVELAKAEEAGVLSQSKRGYIDLFRARIIFPICDHLGRFIGFGGRLQGDGHPKYLNTSQTPLFHKSRVLYGLNWAKNSIKEVDRAVIVEGYTDCISLHARGYNNVIAALGTSLTENHAQLIGRFSKNVTIAFDGDAAGEKATLRGLKVLKEHGLTVHVALLSSGQDPDGFARSHTNEEIGKWLRQALPLVEYEITRIIARHNIQTREGKLAASNELVTVLGELDNAVEFDEYLRFSANQLRIDESSLRNEVTKQKPTMLYSHTGKENRHTIRSVPTEHPTHDELVERDLLRWVLYEPSLLKQLQERGLSDCFMVPEYQHLVKLLIGSSWDEQGAETAAYILSLDRPSGKWAEYVRKFQVVYWRRRLEEIEEKLSFLENEKEGFDINMELYLILQDYYKLRRKIFLSKQIKETPTQGKGG